MSACTCIGCATANDNRDCARFQDHPQHWRLQLAEFARSWWLRHRADLVLDASAVLSGFVGVTLDDRDEVDDVLLACERESYRCEDCKGDGIDPETDDECAACDGGGVALDHSGNRYRVALVKLCGRGLGRVVCPICARDADHDAHAECECGAEWRQDLEGELRASIAAE